MAIDQWPRRHKRQSDRFATECAAFEAHHRAEVALDSSVIRAH